MRLKMFKNSFGMFAAVLFLALFFLTLSLPILSVSAADYVQLAPIPGTASQPPCGNGVTVNCGGTNLSTYLTGMFKVGIVLAGVLAFFTIVWGGFTYLSTDAITGKEEGKARIGRALGGLVLALASFIILNTINPNLVNLNLNFGKATDPADSLRPGSFNYGEELERALDYINTDNNATQAQAQALEKSAKQLKEQVANDQTLTPEQKAEMTKKADALLANAGAFRDYKVTKDLVLKNQKTGDLYITNMTKKSSIAEMQNEQNGLQSTVREMDGTVGRHIKTIQDAALVDPAHQSLYDEWITELKTQARAAKQGMKSRIENEVVNDPSLPESSQAKVKTLTDTINWGENW